MSNPQVYSEELWFSTTTTAGGKLVGFGSEAAGFSGSYDRHVYLSPDGHLNFGAWTGEMNVARSPLAYNDGQWHHLVATQSGDGMKLYVDGELVATHAQTQAQPYSGYWRVGGDSTWDGAPYFAGTIDEVAVYGEELTQAQVTRHWQTGSDQLPVNEVPVAAFTANAADLAVTVDGSGSGDVDGTMESYEWDFGDGATASGRTPAAHTYAAGGTYHVSLTVTDDRGAPTR